MYLVLYFDSPTIHLDEVRLHWIEIGKIFNQQGEGLTWEINNHDYKLDSIAISLDIPEYKECWGIIIDSKSISDWNISIQLASHIRLTEYKNGLNVVPIYIANDQYPDFLNDKNLIKSKHISNFQFTKGFYFKTFEELLGKSQGMLGDEILNIQELPKEERSKLLPGELKNSIFQVSADPTQGRHSTANFWGAHRLANSFGQDISFSLPTTLYFKYNRKHTDKTDKKEEHTVFVNKINVILIDDHYQHGWEEVLSSVLPANVSSFVSRNEVIEFIIKNPDIYNTFDLVFLDLYFSNENNKQEDLKSTFKLLKELKTFNPGVPIIVFTASNKVWNMQRVLSNGADGYFVKESPEQSNIEGFSSANCENFINTINDCYSKGKLLKDYVEKCSFIEKNLIIENKGGAQLRERTIERLNMFLGLLKKGFEQSDFDISTFFYSEYELAYLTLWSVLNEVQEANYVKIENTLPITLLDRKGSEITYHPSGRGIEGIPGYKDWKIRNQENFLLKYDWEFVFDKTGNPELLHENTYKLSPIPITSILYNKNVRPFYFIEENIRDPKENLHLQIAFLVLMGKNWGEVDREYLLELLKESNEYRNHLYITHGENFIDGFYNQTEREKRKKDSNSLPLSKIKNLFYLVSVLLTGQE